MSGEVSFELERVTFGEHSFENVFMPIEELERLRMGFKTQRKPPKFIRLIWAGDSMPAEAGAVETMYLHLIGSDGYNAAICYSKVVAGEDGLEPDGRRYQEFDLTDATSKSVSI